ncbi:glycosyltransferase family 4 protein [Pedobacter psychroterrae]|uniref:Glycosyltransferase family 1 protein n=1 Tax=Pedobacter psychroterrae TaxID=2530453 RepID=A0A4R0NXM1_9SPHI|nr:glycosyltransferase family 1 protein [Pedobacter psychroterrae]TCD03824.1 glycosyltransferase family 1 protein [Pedobacter psychroterrae]
MKIGFDGKRAANNFTGLGNYSRSLIAQLASFFPQNQYLVYTQKIKDRAQVTEFLKDKRIRVCRPENPGLLWRTSGIKKQLLNDKIDLFHGLSHEIPLGIGKTGIASIVTIHDLIFLKFPQYFNPIDRFIYRMKCRYACRHADRIVAISECTKRDIISVYKINPDKIDVVYQSCDDSFKAEPDHAFNETIRIKYSLPQQYILNVGTIEIRKNLLTLIKALKDVDPVCKLVVVGRKTSYMDLVNKEIDRLDLRERVVFLEHVPFKDLPAIYQMAKVFAYPSLYEGFGIPIIEALYSKVPVVAAKGSCLEEAGGNNSFYISPLEHAALASAINQIIASPELQNKMATEGLAYVKRFGNEVIAKDMIHVYNTTLSAKNN